MNEVQYDEYKASLTENIKDLEYQLEELQGELDEIDDKQSSEALNLEARCDSIESELEEDRYELRRLGDSYREYFDDAKEAYEYELWEDMERC